MRDPLTLIKDAIGIFKINPWNFVGIYLVAAIAMPIISSGMIPLGNIFEWMGALRFDGLMLALDLNEIYFRGVFVAVSVFVIGSLMSLALIRAVADPKTMHVGNAYFSRPEQVVSYLVLAALMAVILLVGTKLLILPGVVAAVLFGVSYFVLVHEDKNGFDALKASYQYVKPHWLDVFVRMLLPGVCIYIIHFLARGIAEAFGAGQIYGFLLIAIYTLFVPITFAYMYLLYCDLRAAAEQSETPSSTAKAKELASAHE